MYYYTSIIDDLWLPWDTGCHWYYSILQLSAWLWYNHSIIYYYCVSDICRTFSCLHCATLHLLIILYWKIWHCHLIDIVGPIYISHYYILMRLPSLLTWHSEQYSDTFVRYWIVPTRTHHYLLWLIRLPVLFWTIYTLCSRHSTLFLVFPFLFWFIYCSLTVNIVDNFHVHLPFCCCYSVMNNVVFH